MKVTGGILFAGPTAEFGENIVDGVGDITEHVSLVSLCHSFVFLFFVR